MNGAQALIGTLYANGVEVCFANPGTSEMQLVAAIDRHPRMRAILALFEGVVTGAADGYGRMAGRPAATLLHLGPGLANGCANLHNARRARSPVINIVGDHATHHAALDAPLTSDVARVAAPMSDWVRVSRSADDLAVAGGEAVMAARVAPGQVATLIAPANHAWEPCDPHPGIAAVPPAAPRVAEAAVEAAAETLRTDGPKALFVGGPALTAQALEDLGRIAQASGARLICETFPARLQRGAGRVAVERLPYFGEVAAAFLRDFSAIVFVGAPPPVAFFAYPDKPGRLSPPGAALVVLADARQDVADALGRLAEQLDAPVVASCPAPDPVVETFDGRLTPKVIGALLGELLPPDAIVSDEAGTAGLSIFERTAAAAPHDWLTLTGGSIGQGLPVALGAAIACPDRKVVALQADGSGMYTLQALWTMAREAADVTVVLINNGAYAILQHELQRVGVTDAGEKARALLDLTSPGLDWTSLAAGMGVPAVRVQTPEAFREALQTALAASGPRLVEAYMVRSPGAGR
ncbi:acetolactate synthase large subunit [Caulobacter sp. KR2-114]|uniref:acetolactate synthase large subunit n=1 Tax=Caulobacter sp. KR2-114 TaxID=3400912 RepID=UPI003C00F899